MSGRSAYYAGQVVTLKPGPESMAELAALGLELEEHDGLYLVVPNREAIAAKYPPIPALDSEAA